MYAQLARRYRVWAKGSYRVSLAVSVAAFLASQAVNQYAIGFATERASNPVTDIILSNTPVFNVDGLFVYGTFFVIGVTALILLWDPKRIPFALNALTLFVLIRAGFTSMTHLGPFAPRVASDFGQTITRSFFGDDFFFSGHTGMPFLGALAFWEERPIRNFYLASSIIFAIVVLLGHLHYSIDVFSAFFITYSIFQLACWLFPEQRALFRSRN